ncbi:Bax inhibitor-1/YccA family protein [Alteromonas facilis]|uniref:Bax inhibitor-1/YccA family protein n=1 Tax=Alteromonas facilis TaxID=2048004 RepID=UPI000C28F272|nr:Bax inhibitor-1/YccA family protein [Alteromonas facilis]
MEHRSMYASSAQESAIQTNKVLRSTYMLLSMTLAFSALCAGIAMAVGISRLASIGFMIGGIVTLFILNRKANSAAGIGLVFLFTGLFGAALGPILSFYAGFANGPSIIMQALGGTAIVFLSLSAYALTTKKDFSFLGGFLVVGMVVVLIAAIANIFFQVPAVFLALNAAIIFIMSGFILFDTSRIINGGETNYILATVSLYLNIYNIFTSLLHLLGAFGGDD